MGKKWSLNRCTLWNGCGGEAARCGVAHELALKNWGDSVMRLQEPHFDQRVRTFSFRARQFQWVLTGHITTVYTGDMGNTFGAKGLPALSSRHVS
jgi:hypothetical protein